MLETSKGLLSSALITANLVLTDAVREGNKIKPVVMESHSYNLQM